MDNIGPAITKALTAVREVDMQAANLVGHARRLEQANRVLLSDVEELRGENADLRHRLAEAERAKTTKPVDGLADQVLRLERTITQLHAERDDLRLAVDKRNELVCQLDDEKDRLHERITTLQDQVVKLQEALETVRDTACAQL